MENMKTPEIGGNTARVKKSLALTIASLCTTLTSMALSMLMVRILTLEDLAVYKQTLLAYQTFTPVLGLGISQGIYYVLSRNEHRQRAVVKECCLLLLGTGTLYALFMLLGGREFLANRVSNAVVSSALLWMVPLAMISTPAELRPSIYVYQDRIKQNAQFSVISNLVCVCLILLSVLYFRTGMAAVGAYSIGYCAVGVLGLILAWRLVPKDDAAISTASVRMILKVSIPLGVASMLGTLSNSLDKWIISFMCSPEEYAVFSYGAHELPFLSTIASAISTVIIVDMVKYTKEHKYDEALTLFRNVAKVTSYFIFPTMMLFMVIAEPFYEFMYTESMLAAVPVFRVYLLMLPVRTVMYGPLMIAMGKSKQVLYRTIAGLIANLILSILLVLWIGTIGATIATVITLYLVSVPYNLAVISKETHSQWRELLPFKHFGKCLLMSLIPAGICYVTLPVINGLPLILRLVISGCIYLIILIPLFFTLFKNDSRVIWKKVKQFMKGLHVGRRNDIE